MDEQEASWILRSCSAAQRQDGPAAWPAIAAELAGRQAADAEAFFEDHRAGRAAPGRQQAILAGADTLVMAGPKGEAAARPRPLARREFLLERAISGSSRRQPDVLGGYSEVASWAGCSGTVIQLATPGQPQPGGLYTCLAGSATETDPGRQRPGQQDPYNRQGELVAMELGPTRLRCRVLDGHRVGLGGGRVQRSTVSCVVHSERNRAYLSGGFDGAVSAWSDSGLRLLARLGPHGCAINTIVADARTPGILYGTARGELVWCADPLQVLPATGAPACTTVCPPRAADTGAALADSLDVLALTARRTAAVALAGYGYVTACRGGVVDLHDLAAQRPAGSVAMGPGRALTDMALHPLEHLLALVSGRLFDDRSCLGDGRIRLVDLRALALPAAVVPTRQKDVHRVAFSPCGGLVYTNDATSGLMLVHDLRSTARPLWAHTHSRAGARQGPDDHAVGFAWLPAGVAGIPGSGMLLTGGNDAHVKLWDLGRAEPLVEAVDLRQPVNNLAVSADATHVWAGTEAGSVHLLSRNGSLAGEFADNIEIAYDFPAL